MKVTGIVRQVDPLGRIVIPVEIHKTNGIKPHGNMGTEFRFTLSWE